MWGSFATRLKLGQLVCEVEAEHQAFMSCSRVTWGDLSFINHIENIAWKKKKKALTQSIPALMDLGSLKLYKAERDE